ncbi:MAG: FeoA family protein [Caulobacteraceae bacterium]
MTLDKAQRGSKIRIKEVLNKALKSQAIRLGIYEGAVFLCSEKLPGGPVILQNRQQEIAVGKGLAEKIQIEGVKR